MNQRTILRSVLITVLTLVATAATAHDFEVDGIYYNYNGTGKVSVTYQGSSYDEYADEYKGDVVIPPSVTDPLSGTTYSVTSIGGYAFRDCTGLTSVTIGNSVTSIDGYAFQGCSGLTSITIPNSVTSIGNEAFQGCSGLTSIIVDSENQIYDSRENCNAIIKTASNKLLYGCKNTIIPNSVSSIGDNAFRDCSGLTSVTIPNSVTSIGGYVFYGCSGLTSVTIGNSVTSIGRYAFDGCSGLTRVDISSLEAWLGIKFENADTNPLYYANHLYLNGEEVKDLVIPNSVTSIGDYAFYKCEGLTSITIPNSVKSIGDCAFRYCSGLTSVTIPNSVETIGNYAFDYSGLASVTIGNSVTSIGKEAFHGCSGLTSITMGNSVTSIGEMAFHNCSGLTRVDISSIEAWLGIKFADSSSNPLSYAGHLYLNGEEVKDLVIPNSVTSIGKCAFYGYSGLTSVTIPNSVTSIGSSAFSFCSGLTSVTIPNSVTSIGNSAFYICRGLKSVTIGNSVTSIGDNAFRDCSGLISITIGNSVTSIGDYAFWGCYDLTSIISKAVTPPTCCRYTFYDYSATLIVPSIAKAAYTYVADWNKFSKYAEPDNKITAIAINNNEANFVFDNTLQLSATVTPEDATFADVLQWESSNPEVATVDNKGLVTSHDLGSAIITARSCDGSNISATCTVVVCEKAANVNFLVEGDNIVGFGLQGVKMHNGVLYACTTTESVNMSTPTLHGNNANNMAPYEDRNFAEFDQRDWVAISGLEGDFEGKELSNPFVANFADGVLTPSGTISATAEATAYTLNTFRAENILHGGYSKYAVGDYKAYYVPARVNEVAKFMGLIETIGGVKYLYSNNSYGRKDGEGIKVENCTIEDNSKVYSLLEGILVADKSTKAGVKIIMLDYLGEATGVEGVDAAAARIYSANGNIIIAATEDGEAAVYDFTGRLIKSVPVVAGDNTAVPVMPGCYIVRTGVKTQSVVVK